MIVTVALCVNEIKKRIKKTLVKTADRLYDLYMQEYNEKSNLVVKLQRRTTTVLPRGTKKVIIKNF